MQVAKKMGDEWAFSGVIVIKGSVIVIEETVIVVTAQVLGFCKQKSWGFVKKISAGSVRYKLNIF